MLGCKPNSYFSEDLPIRRKLSIPNAEANKQTPSEGMLGVADCQGLSVKGACLHLDSIGRCHRTVVGNEKLTNFSYPSGRSDCGAVGFTIESPSYFRASRSEGLTINRWTRDVEDGLLMVYLPDGEKPEGIGGNWRLAGAGFRVLPEANPALSQYLIPLHQCRTKCDAGVPCELALPWYSLDSSCEGVGQNLKTIGWVFRP